MALPLHGVAHSDDLAVQAFARHLAAAAGPAGRSVIAGMRAFLEDKPQLMPDPPWPAPPPTGYRAVEALAVAAGCGDTEIALARDASRRDLAGSAWILEPTDGIEDLLRLVDGRARLLVIADADDPATAPVLDALDLVERVETAGIADLVDTVRLASTLAPHPVLLIDVSWSPVLAAGRATGHTTAMIDRFRTGLGEPDLRAADLSGLLPGIAAWLDDHPGPGDRPTSIGGTA